MILKNKKGSQEMSTSTPVRSIRSTAELRLESVTMTIEVALGGRRRVCFRQRQTEKERSVTVINVLAESETAISQDPRLQQHPSVNKHSTKSHKSATFNHNRLNYASRHYSARLVGIIRMLV